MQMCEVMLKDIAESRRLSTLILEQMDATQVDYPLRVFIMSRLFWPQFRHEPLALPPKLQTVIDDYTAKYEKLKAARTLDFIPHLGTVDLELELAGQTLELSVSPLQAAIIVLFETQETWTLEALSNKLQVCFVCLSVFVLTWFVRSFFSLFLLFFFPSFLFLS